jgi:hypothetical protein
MSIWRLWLGKISGIWSRSAGTKSPDSLCTKYMPSICEEMQSLIEDIPQTLSVMVKLFDFNFKWTSEVICQTKWCASSSFFQYRPTGLNDISATTHFYRQFFNLFSNWDLLKNVLGMTLAQFARQDFLNDLMFHVWKLLAISGSENEMKRCVFL